MPEYLTTRELAELLRIKERKVYDLASSGELPCSRAMGKLLFPREAVHAWLARGGSGLPSFATAPRPAVLLGSHDPLLDWALRESQCGIATYLDGSADGVERFRQGEGVATGLHLYDPQRDDWNVEFIREQCGNLPAVLVHWATRQRGLIVGEKLGDQVRSIPDLKGRRITPRQAASGAQRLFEHLREQAGLRPGDLQLTAPARSEVDLALSVLEGKADAAFGLAAVAAQYRLPFVPVVAERFDLLVERRAWFEPPMQAFFNFCGSRRFAEHAAGLAGYDVSELGAVRFNGA
ncbi:MAG: helix-turn-helix transcriptional regulator [Gammaproteobacteria bacterium]|nr:helix-turn-helix transcriptional regulator [Gammaproteobacteria bacterium]